MEKLISNTRYYLDVNSTAPLSQSVKNWLKSGAVEFYNPSSIHRSGKLAKKIVRDATEKIRNAFSRELENHQFFFHSGATEGINSVFKGFALACIENKAKPHIIFYKTDHSCVVSQATTLKMLGAEVHCLEVAKNFEFPEAQLQKLISSLEGPCLLNHTWVHNETGVVWPLELLLTLKKKIKKNDLYIHIDSAQVPGKIENWNTLNETLDAYTFSSHKFGGPKGIGFTFMRSDFPFHAIIEGGGQQSSLRSGTENVSGIHATSLAIEDLCKEDSYVNDRKGRDYFINELKLRFQDSITFLHSSMTNTNTVFFIFHKAKSDIVTTALDIDGIEVSSGSACTSGATIPNRIVLSLGFSKQDAFSAIRVSFPRGLDQACYKQIFEKFASVLARYI